MKKSDPVPAAIRDFLHTATPMEWARAISADLPLLLNDHANCEKKAAATAISLTFRYGDDAALCERMSRLAREELRHYEMVMRVMRQRNIPHQALGAGRYARRLRDAMRTDEPGRRVDTLIIGAYIEARSCERFAILVPLLDAELGRFYSGLLASEARHFEHYLALARQNDPVSANSRIAAFGELEGELAVSPDTQLRFHSGPQEA